MPSHDRQTQQAAQTWAYTFFLKRHELLYFVTETSLLDDEALEHFHHSMQEDGSYVIHASDAALLKSIKAMLNIFVQLQAFSTLLLDDLNKTKKSKSWATLLFQIGKVAIHYRSISKNIKALEKHVDDLEIQVKEMRNLPELRALMRQVLTETIGPQLRYLNELRKSPGPVLDSAAQEDLEGLDATLHTINRNINALIAQCEKISEEKVKAGVKENLSTGLELVQSLQKSQRHAQDFIEAIKRREVISAKSIFYESLEEIGNAVIKLQQLNTGNESLVKTAAVEYTKKLLVAIQPVLVALSSSLEMIEGQTGMSSEHLQDKLSEICQAHETLATQMKISGMNHYPYWREKLAIHRKKLNTIAGRQALILHLQKQIAQTPLDSETPHLHELISLKMNIHRAELINTGPYGKMLDKIIYRRIGLETLVNDMHLLAEECKALQARQQSLKPAEKSSLDEKLARLEKLHLLEKELRESFDHARETDSGILSYDREHQSLAYGVFEAFKGGKRITASPEDRRVIHERVDSYQQSLAHDYAHHLAHVEHIEKQLAKEDTPFEEKEVLLRHQQFLLSLSTADLPRMSLKDLRDLSKRTKEEFKDDHALVNELELIIKIRSGYEKDLAILDKYLKRDAAKRLLQGENMQRSNVPGLLKMTKDQVIKKINSSDWEACVKKRIEEIQAQATSRMRVVAARLPQHAYTHLSPTSSGSLPHQDTGEASIPPEQLPEKVLRINNAPRNYHVKKVTQQLFHLKDQLPRAKEKILKLTNNPFVNKQQREALLSSKNPQGYYAPQAHDSMIIKLVKSALNILQTMEDLANLLLILESQMSIKNIRQLYTNQQEVRRLVDQLRNQLGDLSLHLNTLKKILPDISMDALLNVPLASNIYRQLEAPLHFFKSFYGDSDVLGSINHFLTTPPAHTPSEGPKINVASCLSHLDGIIHAQWPEEKDRMKGGLYKVKKKGDDLKANILKLRNLIYNINSALDMTVSIANKTTEPQLLELFQIMLHIHGRMPKMPKELRLVMQEMNAAIQPFFIQLGTWPYFAEHPLGIHMESFEQKSKELCLKYERFALTCGLQLTSGYPYTEEKIQRLKHEIVNNREEEKKRSETLHTLAHLHSLKLKNTDLPSFVRPFADLIQMRNTLQKLPPSGTAAALDALNAMIYKHCGLDRRQAEITQVEEQIAALEQKILQEHARLTKARFERLETKLHEKNVATLILDKITLHNTLRELHEKREKTLRQLDQSPSPYQNDKIDLLECKSTDFLPAIEALEHAQAQAQIDFIWLQQAMQTQQIKKQSAFHLKESTAHLHKMLKDLKQLEPNDLLPLPLLENRVRRLSNEWMMAYESFKLKLETATNQFKLEYQEVASSGGSEEKKKHRMAALLEEQKSCYDQLEAAHQQKIEKALALTKHRVITDFLTQAADQETALFYLDQFKNIPAHDLFAHLKNTAAAQTSQLGRYTRNKLHKSNLHDQLYALIRLLEKQFPEHDHPLTTKEILVELDHQQPDHKPHTTSPLLTTSPSSSIETKTLPAKKPAPDVAIKDKPRLQ